MSQQWKPIGKPTGLIMQEFRIKDLTSSSIYEKIMLHDFTFSL